MGCCHSSEAGEQEPLLPDDKATSSSSAAAPAEGAGYQGSGNGGGLFQSGAAPQVVTMQDDAKGDAIAADEQPKEEAGDDAGAKAEDSKSVAVINETQKKLIDLTGEEEDEDAGESAAPSVEGSIRVGTTQTLAAVPVSPVKETSSTKVPVAGGDADDDDDDLDLTGVSVPVSKEGDMARRMGSSLAADVHSVAAQPAAEVKDVVKSLGEVKEDAPAEEPKEEQPKEEVKEAPAEPEASAE